MNAESPLQVEEAATIPLTRGQVAIVDAEDFAYAYDRAAIELRGQFACTNKMLKSGKEPLSRPGESGMASQRILYLTGSTRKQESRR